jgi:hypothetical protein
MASRAVRATSHDEVQQIVREEFEHWFGPDSIMREESLEVIAAEVFEAVNKPPIRRGQRIPLLTQSRSIRVRARHEGRKILKSDAFGFEEE